MRSSVEPQTIASETAQNTNWKNHLDSTVALRRPMTGNAVGRVAEAREHEARAADEAARGRSGSLPNANAKPTKYQQIAAIEKFVRIFATIVPAFFWLEKPISRNMKPHCMNITTMPATITHSELKPTESGRTPLL